MRPQAKFPRTISTIKTSIKRINFILRLFITLRLKSQLNNSSTAFVVIVLSRRQTEFWCASLSFAFVSLKSKLTEVKNDVLFEFLRDKTVWTQCVSFTRKGKPIHEAFVWTRWRVTISTRLEDFSKFTAFFSVTLVFASLFQH